jgi:iron complex outermembrane receptor protein
MKHFLLSILLLLLSQFLLAQATLTGRVLNAKTHESLIGVSVYADNAIVAVTDVDGKYSATLPVGKHQLFFRMLGMTEKKENVDLKDKENSILIIMLEESAKELGLIVVSAGKFEQRIEDVTVSMNVIKPSLVEDKNTTSMDDIIDQSPSVSIIDGQANIRGGSGWSYGAGSRVMVLVDDLPMLTADAGDVKWSFLPVENVEQIEIIKGASSALFGSSAMNGVINIRTEYPKDIPITRLNFSTGIYDTKQRLTLNDTTYNLNWGGSIPQRISTVSFFHSQKIQNFDLVLGGHMLQDQSYLQGQYENRVRFNCNTRYRFKNVDGLSCGVNFNTQYAVGSLFFIWKDDTTGGYKPLPGNLSDYTTYRTNVDPYITYISPNGTSLKFRSRYFRSNNLNNTNQQSLAESFYREYQYQKRIAEKVTLSAGAVETSSKVTSELYGNHDGGSLAFYLQGDMKLSKWNFSLGGRIENNRTDTVRSNFHGVIRSGINYNLVGETYLRASYGQGYRYPTIAEKYISTAIGSATIYPNDSLKSESGYSTEVGIMQGVKIGDWKGYFDAAAFYTEYHNMIEFTFSLWEPLTYDFNTNTYRGLGFKALNIGNTRIKGLDLSFSGEGNIGPIGVSVLAGYTYMVPEALSYDSAYINAQHKLEPPDVYKAYLGSDSTNFLKYRYSHLVKGDVGLNYRKVSMGIGVRYNSFMENIDELFVDPNFGSIVTPGVSHYREAHRTGDIVWDARAAYQINRTMKFAFIVKNIFNYIFMQRPADMQPPRVFTGQLTVTL